MNQLSWTAIAAAMMLAAPLSATEKNDLGENGWSYAKWGMSVEELIAASDGTATASDMENSDLASWGHPEGAAGVILLDGEATDVTFHFNPESKKLAFLKLDKQDIDSCRKMESHFIGVLGDARQRHVIVDGGPNEALNLYAREWPNASKGNRYQQTIATVKDSDYVICFTSVMDASLDIGPN